MKTNISSSTVPTEAAGPSYHQFPAQAARIPTSYSQLQLDALQAANSSPQASREQTLTTHVSSPHLTGLNRDNSWPVEGFGDLHLSGGEPRIFPGVVSRSQRRDSVARKGSISETDDYASAGTPRKGKSSASGKVVDGTVKERDEEEQSDEEMEEAGGRDA